MKKISRSWLFALALFFSVAIITPSCAPLLDMLTQSSTTNNDDDDEKDDDDGTTSNDNTSKGKK